MRADAAALILAVAGKRLTADERALLAERPPAGLILFARNIADRDQLRALIAEFREIAGDRALVLVDQEGGRVERLRPPLVTPLPAMRRFGLIAEGGDFVRAAAALELAVRLQAQDLRALDIDMNCAPVLDLLHADADPVIGDRAFSGDPQIVSRLGRVAVEAMLAAGILPVVKHIPGHGRANRDTHHAPAIIDTPEDVLAREDFLPFRDLADAPAAMTAHVVYAAIDDRRPASLSPAVLEGLVRRDFGFEGLLLSDDLAMGALATVYTALGGLSAVLWTDLVQFVILVTGAIWVAVSLCASVPGGASGILEIASRNDHLHVIDWRFSLVEMTGIAVGVSYFLQLMQDYGTDQVTVQRLMAVKTFRGMAKAVIFNSLADLVIVSLLLFVGLGLFAYYHSFPNALVEEIRDDRVLPYYIIHSLPPGVSGLLITAIFAAAMSSMDSGINSMTTVVVTDLVKPLRTIRQTEQHDIKLARMLTLLLGSLATGVAFYVSQIEQIVKASSAFLGLFAGPILALFLLGMLTRRANFHGWLAGVLTAIPATIWLQHGTNVHFVYYFPFCFVISGCVGYVASVVVDIFGGGSTADRNLTIWDRQWPS